MQMPGHPAARILAAFRRADRVLDAAFRRYIRDQGLTTSQALLLRLLAEAERPLTLNEVAGELDLAKSTASEEVDRLVKAGQIQRERDPSCRRRVLIGLTGEGRSLAEAGPLAVSERLAAHLASLPRTELAAIETGLAGLAEALAGFAGDFDARRRQETATQPHPAETEDPK